MPSNLSMLSTSRPHLFNALSMVVASRCRVLGPSPQPFSQIPLPPLATQQAIVSEFEAEKALVAANREPITRFDQKTQSTLYRIRGEEAPTPVVE